MHLTVEQIPSKLRGSIWACLIAPRPIALVSTQDAQGLPNIAPYNAFCGLASNPPLLGISFSRRADEEKHTLANIKATGAFAVNLVPRFLADVMNQAAEGVEKSDDFVRLKLTSAACETINCPRIAESPASLECRLINTVPLPPSRCELVIGQIVGVFMRDEYVSSDIGFDTLAADLLASVGPEDYVSVNGETLHLPKVW